MQASLTPGLLAFLLGACASWAAAPVRLALVAGPDSRIASDLLLVELGHSVDIDLVERDEIDKVLEEISLSSLLDDPGAGVKAGGLLHADGILFLSTRRQGTALQRSVRLSAVEAGVVVHSSTEGIADSDDAAWAKKFRPRLERLLPKLTLGREELIPFSILHFRAEMGGADNRELERSATALLEESLSGLPGVVVLERRRMDSLEFERILQWDREASHLWTCGAMVDGSLKMGLGAESNSVAITAYLHPPGATEPDRVRIDATRDTLESAMRMCAERVVQRHARLRTKDCWSPKAEGERFLREAVSACNAKLYKEAASAAEVARILGVDSPQLRSLRTTANLYAAFPDVLLAPILEGYGQRANWDGNFDALSPAHTLRAIEAFSEEMDGAGWTLESLFFQENWVKLRASQVADWVCAMLRLLNLPSRPVHLAEVEGEISQQMGRVVDRIMRVVEDAGPEERNGQTKVGFRFARLHFWGRYCAWQSIATAHAMLWNTTPEETLAYYRRVLRLEIPIEREGRQLVELLARDSLRPFPVGGVDLDTPRELPLFLDKRTQVPDDKILAEWHSELAATDSMSGRYAWNQYRLAHVQSREEHRVATERIAAECAAWAALEAQSRSEGEAAFRAANPSARILGPLKNTNSSPSGDVPAISPEATLFWEPPWEKLDPRPPEGNAYIADVREVGGQTWFVIYYTKLGTMSWWLVRRDDQGKTELILPFQRKTQFWREYHLKIHWTADERFLAVAIDDRAVWFDLRTMERKEVRTGVVCSWPVLCPPWIYFAFQGDGCGILRVHEDSGNVEVLCNSRRKPAQTPYDDHAEHWIGPGIPLPGGQVGYLGAWDPTTDRLGSLLRIDSHPPR